MQVRFEFERETKNKVRFSEIAKEGEEVIGKLYVSKTAVEALGSPDTIHVTIEKVATAKKGAK